eukprot:8520-Heterococcus_DN1.PRE.7
MLCLTVVLDDTLTVTVCIHQPFASESSDDSTSGSSNQQQTAWWLTRGSDVARSVKPIWASSGLLIGQVPQRCSDGSTTTATTGHKGAITALTYCPVKQQLLSFGYEGALNMWTVEPLDTAAIAQCSTAQTSTNYGYTGMTALAVKHNSSSTANSTLQSLQQCILNASGSNSDDVSATSPHAWSASWLPSCSSSSVLVCMSNGELLRLEVAAATGRCSATVLLRAHAGRLSDLEAVPASGSANDLANGSPNGSEFVTVSKARHGGQLMLWNTAERACIGYTAVPFVPACVAVSAEHIAVCSHSAPATVHMYSIVRDHTRNGNSSNGQSNCKLQLVTVFTLPASVHNSSKGSNTAAAASATSGSDTVTLTTATGKSLHASPPRGFGSTFTGSVDGGASQWIVVVTANTAFHLAEVQTTLTTATYSTQPSLQH